MSNIARLDPTSIQPVDDDHVQYLMQTVCRGLGKHDTAHFLRVAQRLDLDPFAQQIYAIPRGGKMSIQISIEGLRIIAERSGKYAGQGGPWWCGADGQWRDVWLEKDPPAAAKVEVYRSESDRPVIGIATRTEVADPRNPQWKRMPAHMLAKVAEANALRRAFPNVIPDVDVETYEVPATSVDYDVIEPEPKRLPAGDPWPERTPELLAITCRLQPQFSATSVEDFYNRTLKTWAGSSGREVDDAFVDELIERAEARIAAGEHNPD